MVGVWGWEGLLMEANLTPAFCCGLWILFMDSVQHHIFVQLHFSTDLVSAAQPSTADSPGTQSVKQRSARDFKCVHGATQKWSAYTGHQNSGASLIRTWVFLAMRLFLQDRYCWVGCHATPMKRIAMKWGTCNCNFLFSLGNRLCQRSFWCPVAIGTRTPCCSLQPLCLGKCACTGDC